MDLRNHVADDGTLREGRGEPVTGFHDDSVCVCLFFFMCMCVCVEIMQIDRQTDKQRQRQTNKQKGFYNTHLRDGVAP